MPKIGCDFVTSLDLTQHILAINNKVLKQAVNKATDCKNVKELGQNITKEWEYFVQNKIGAEEDYVLRWEVILLLNI